MPPRQVIVEHDRAKFLTSLHGVVTPAAWWQARVYVALIPFLEADIRSLLLARWQMDGQIAKRLDRSYGRAKFMVTMEDAMQMTGPDEKRRT